MKTNVRRGSWTAATSWNPRIHERPHRVKVTISDADARAAMRKAHPNVESAARRGREMTETEKRAMSAALGLSVTVRTNESRVRHTYAGVRHHLSWEGSVIGASQDSAD